MTNSANTLNPQYLKNTLEQSIVDKCLETLIEINKHIISGLNNHWAKHPEGTLSGPFFPSTSEMFNRSLK